jgi:hypothetical protein
MSRFGSPLFASAASIATAALFAVCADSGYTALFTSDRSHAMPSPSRGLRYRLGRALVASSGLTPWQAVSRRLRLWPPFR